MYRTKNLGELRIENVGEEVELREYESGNYIASIIDQRITLFDFDFDSSNLSFDHVSDKYDVTINKIKDV